MPSFTRRDFGRLSFFAAVVGLPRPATAASILPSTSRICATCAYWKGPRLPSMNRNGVIVAAGAKGRCTNPKSPFSGLMTTPEQGFPDGWRRAAGLV
ncbi:hypothetical protein [Agaricicola taiwanensis]|uniref:hypothetical protein n=1 Tax=Agaricicola taiwanensis TaxID=591372 RepID=UPI0016692969|nr:hypothetical protein [Agaricicola taiwanensis]